MKSPALVLLPLLLCGCDQSMTAQPKYRTYARAETWPNGSAARTLPEHVVAMDDEARVEAATRAPAVTPEMVRRGQERFNIYCAPCHGLGGIGDGMIVQRGFPPPPSFSSPRLQATSGQHIFDVITNGYGVMYAYSARVAEEDRWAIVAYVRALQASGGVRVADVPGARDKLR